ncbi:hypothetical protein J6590_101608, partial [Homalodisca vitripennis]
LPNVEVDSNDESEMIAPDETEPKRKRVHQNGRNLKIVAALLRWRGGRGQGRGAPHSPTAVSLHSHRRSFSLVFSCRSTCKPVNISALGYLHCDNEWFRLSFPKDSERVSPEPLERAPASVSVQCAKPAFPMTDLFRMMQNPLLGYKPLQFLGAPMLLMAGGAPSSSGSDSGSPSPPVTPGKSFTIDAILGLHNNSTNSAIDYSSRSIAGESTNIFVTTIVNE